MNNLKGLKNNICIELFFGHQLKYLSHYLETYTNDDWKKYIDFDDSSYKRSMVYKNKLCDIYIISWKKGQKCKIHNHAINGCLMKILQGSLTECRYNKDLNLISKSILKKNDISYIDNTIGYHNILSKEDSISLHIYSPPDHKTIFYD